MLQSVMDLNYGPSITICKFVLQGSIVSLIVILVPQSIYLVQSNKLFLQAFTKTAISIALLGEWASQCKVSSYDVHVVHNNITPKTAMTFHPNLHPVRFSELAENPIWE